MAKSSSKCPICGQAHTPLEQYCPFCSWEYRVFPDSVSSVVLEMEKEREEKYREIFHKVNNNETILAGYKDRIAELEATSLKNEQTIKDLEKKLAKKEERNSDESHRKTMEENKSAKGVSFIVGREGLQHKEILEKTVSRQHCRVTVLENDMVEIENLSKTNGTEINGERVDRIQTSMDSTLKMGNYVIKVRELFPPKKATARLEKQKTV